MNNQKHFLTLLLILGACAETSPAQAAIADAVVVWGDNSYGQATVPIAAQSAVVAIAAGYDHTVALKTDGTVVAWGRIFDGTNANAIAATVPADLSGVTAIAAGAAHTVALKNDGSVVAWGNNAYGQTTVPVAAQSGVTAIAAGNVHTVALKNDGSVVAWGYNLQGQVTGTPITAQPYSAIASPVTLGGRVLNGVTAIAAGDTHTVALKNDGSVVAWGSNESGQSTVPAGLNGVKAIAAGLYHTVALKTDGSVVAWGSDGYGQTTVPLAAQSGVTAIAAGWQQTVALKNGGSVVGWGYNEFGQTDVPAGLSGVTAIAAGFGHTVVLVVPIAPTIITQPVRQAVGEWQPAMFTVTATGYPLNYQWRKDGVDIAGATSGTYSLPFAQTNQAGNYTVVVNNVLGSVTSAPPTVLTVNPASPGSVVAWGDNSYGQTTVPVAAQGGVTAIAAGYGHTVALKTDGSVVAWGKIYDGLNNLDGPNYVSATVPADLSEVTAIAAGASHTAALKNDGTVVAWGFNGNGQVTGIPSADEPGTATATAIANPVIVKGQVLSGVTAIAAGRSSTYAVKNDGTVVGLGAFDQTIVAGLTGMTAIAVGWGGGYLIGEHAVALKNDGSVVAWGDDTYGEVTGTPITTWPPHSATANPVTLGGEALSGVMAIAAGGSHSAALKSDGSVVVWGDNPYGKTTVPTAAQSRGVTAIAAGIGHMVGLKNDGSVVAWGDNSAGQTDVPLGLSGVTAIAAGGRHTLAVLGTAVSTVAPLIPNAPTITMQPVSQTVKMGQSASFTVTATGYPLNYNYQWRRQEINISGATGATYNLGPAQSSQAGDYTVVVSNSEGSVTSAPPAALTVNPASSGGVLAWGDNHYAQTTTSVAAQSDVTAIAAGAYHTAALKTDGSVLAWGNNDSGQTTVPIAAQSGVMAIAAGGSHTVALKTDGSVLAWGKNRSGQRNVPLAAQSSVAAIAAGYDHTVALKSDGSVLAWGDDSYGQTTGPTGFSGVTAIAAGVGYTVALKTDGSVVAWGNNEQGQTKVPVAAQSGVTAIAAGNQHTVALKTDGSMLAWGDNGAGQTDVPVAAQSGVTAIAAGYDYTVALKTDGSVEAWGGDNRSGQTDVPATAQNGFLAIAAGYAHTVALVILSRPTVTITQPVSQTVNIGQRMSFSVSATGYPLNYQWRKDGINISGATQATYTDLARANQAGVYSVVVSNLLGSVTSPPVAVLRVDPASPGSVVAWGDDSAGQTTVPVAAQSGVMAIAAGAGYTVALKTDGSVLAWGNQTNVPPAAQTGVMAIAASMLHTVALKTDGSVVAWGNNYDGQVTGTPTTDEPRFRIASPVTLGGQVLSGVTAIAASSQHTVALKNDGSVLAWGWNQYGQTTVPLAAQSGVTAIAAGSGHTVALKTDGSVLAWGDNTYRQARVPVAAQSGVMAIAAGYGHTVVLKSDGSVLAWGAGTSNTGNFPNYGQSLVPVAAQSGVTAIATAGYHTVALKSDGSVVAWGAGTSNTGYFSEHGQSLVPGALQSGVTTIAAGWFHTVAILGTAVSLQAKFGGNGPSLSWPTNKVGFTLQSTASLAPPVVWRDFATVPDVDGPQFTVPIANVGRGQFFRLKKP